MISSSPAAASLSAPLRRVRGGALLAVAFAGIGVAVPALAEEPEVAFRDDGTVVGRLVVDATPDQVRAAIGEVQGKVRVTNVLDLKLIPDGACASITRTTRGLLSPMTMKTRLCPTPDGWREWLVESSDFNAYETTWKVSPQEGGRARVEILVKSELSFLAPKALVRQGTVKGIHESFAAVLARLLTKGARSATSSP
jgi:hypothetical protein